MKLSFKHACDILMDMATPKQIDKIARDVVEETGGNYTESLRILEKRFAQLTDRHDFLWCNIAGPLVTQILARKELEKD